jgi:uncharacterized membrane protein
VSDAPENKEAIDPALAEDIPTKADSPLGIMKLHASVEGMRAEMRVANSEIRSELDDIRKTLARMEANYNALFHEFQSRYDVHEARIVRVERSSRKTAPSIKKTRPKR